MKKIEFVTSRGTGYVEIPDDTTSIKIPKGVCENCEEDIEILTHSVFTNQQDVITNQKDASVASDVITDVIKPVVKTVVKNKDEEDLELMLPNL